MALTPQEMVGKEKTSKTHVRAFVPQIADQDIKNVKELGEKLRILNSPETSLAERAEPLPTTSKNELSQKKIDLQELSQRGSYETHLFEAG